MSSQEWLVDIYAVGGIRSTKQMLNSMRSVGLEPVLYDIGASPAARSAVFKMSEIDGNPQLPRVYVRRAVPNKTMTLVHFGSSWPVLHGMLQLTHVIDNEKLLPTAA